VLCTVHICEEKDEGVEKREALKISARSKREKKEKKKKRGN